MNLDEAIWKYPKFHISFMKAVNNPNFYGFTGTWFNFLTLLLLINKIITRQSQDIIHRKLIQFFAVTDKQSNPDATFHLRWGLSEQDSNHSKTHLYKYSNIQIYACTNTRKLINFCDLVNKIIRSRWRVNYLPFSVWTSEDSEYIHTKTQIYKYVTVQI